VRRHVTSYAIAVLLATAAVPAAGCSGRGGDSPAVPSLSQHARAGGQGSGGSAAARASALHAAAQCIRQHGVPGYSDPVLTPGGAVYSDSRSVQDASQPVLDAIQQACGALLTQANLSPLDEPPAPTQLVQAGVRAAECLRANGMPHVTDPTAQSPYTPGHGFGMSASEFPAGGKQSPVWQHAAQACRTKIDAELGASTLGSLSNDG
jgi:hypothetical protein